MFDKVWLIPFFPIVGVLINGLFGRSIEKINKNLVHWIGCGSVGLSFIVTVVIFIQMLGLPPEERMYNYIWFDWISAGTLQTAVAYQIDAISMFMCLFVTGVGFLIHIYSIGYMIHDEGRYYRYFAYLNLFMFSMINLILADNFLLMFLGWEGVGVCSYLLISFWFSDEANAVAGKKAFITNRVGDFFFLIGMLLLYINLGKHDIWSLKYNDVFAHASLLSPDLITVICLLFFLGCTAKSAQIPLYIWLPDAMAGPTPVSALIHAATMVTSGVYFVARCNVLYSMSPLAMGVVAVVGALTALLAATIALTQNDIKKVLAYSTVSQLGYMFLGLGVGAFSAGLFHVLTHSFFKALLFMGAGSVIHAMGNEQDMRNMGGLRKKMPVTFWTMLLATLAIVGFPGFSGFFSKDEILWQAFSSPHGHFLLWLIGVTVAALTTFYMFRLIFMTFFNECRAPEDVQHHLHESPKSMTVPMMILAALSVVGGFIGIPAALGGSNLVEHYLEPLMGLGAGKVLSGAAASTHHGAAAAHEAAHHSYAVEYMLMGFVLAIVFIGIYTAYVMYIKKQTIPKKLAEQFTGFHRLLFNKWYVDEMYEAVVIRPLHGFSHFLWKAIDVAIIDGLVNGTARFFMGFGGILRYMQSGYVARYAISIIIGALVLMGYYYYTLYL